MVMNLSTKEDAKININTFEIAIESLLDNAKWKEALILIKTMDKFNIKPSVHICVALVQELEKARQYKAVLALYQYMIQRGYDFYENTFLDGVFKRLVDVAAVSVDAKFKASLLPILNKSNIDHSNNNNFVDGSFNKNNNAERINNSNNVAIDKINNLV
jgi:hypothetical protein